MTAQTVETSSRWSPIEVVLYPNNPGHQIEIISKDGRSQFRGTIEVVSVDPISGYLRLELANLAWRMGAGPWQLFCGPTTIYIPKGIWGEWDEAGALVWDREGTRVRILHGSTRPLREIIGREILPFLRPTPTSISS